MVMKEQPAKNYYKIWIDREKNRNYSVLREFRSDLDAVPNCEKDFLSVPKKLRPENTSLFDVREFKTQRPDVIHMSVKIKGKKVEINVRKRAARVVSQPLEKLAEDRIRKDAQVKDGSALFNTPEEAER